MSQTSYSINTPAWSYPGQVADNMQVKDILSCLAVAAALPYGLCVVRDETNTGDFSELAAKLPASGGDVVNGNVLGIVVADQARAQDPSLADAEYPQYSAVPIMKVGRVVVASESAVTDGQPVYVRIATGSGGSQKGALRGDNDSGTAVAMPNAIWIGTVAAAGFAVVELLEA